jgi:hydrogenase-4 component F
MIFLFLTLAVPCLGVFLMAAFGQGRASGIINIALTTITLITSLVLGVSFSHNSSLISSSQQFYVDAFSLLLIILTTFITTTTAIFSYGYMRHNLAIGKITKNYLRLYHIMYQLFMFMILLTLSTNNIGVLWVAMEGSTLATVLLVSLYRTPYAVEAAWKYFILCVVGIALALFGTILLYSSASQLFMTNNSAILWTVLYKNAAALDAPIIKLAFVFLLVGYGTKMGLVPLHNWLPDAYSESPAPVAALLSGLLSNVALYTLIRFKMIVDLALNSHLSGYLMMGFGLLSFIVAAILMHRQKNIKRLFSYSSIEHMGLITFGFGLGGALATFGSLFYMLVHSLVKSALFVNIGNITQFSKEQNLEQIKGLIRSQPLIGWGLLLAALVVCGFPPFGIFISEFLLFIATMKSFPWLAVFLIFGFITALAGILRNIHPIVYGESDASMGSKISNMLPIILHLSLALILGLYLPSALSALLKQAAAIIGG